MKILVATEKPFAAVAVNGIKEIAKEAGHDVVLLEKYSDKARLVAAVADADALIVRSDKVTAEVIEAAEKLKIVVRAGAGYDNIDLQSCTQSGKKIGIQAYGNVGKLVARKAAALGMQVMAYDPFVDSSVMTDDGVTPAATLEEMYSECNFISLHIPATPETVGSIGYDLISKMPSGGCLLNTARKEIINEAELVKVLTDRPDLKYITDIAAVCQSELNEKFGKRVFATPKKMGAETMEANVNAGLAAARQICRFFATGCRDFQVNK